MTWGKMDDKFHRNRKVRELRRKRGGREALGVWVFWWSWCLDDPSLDGFVPVTELSREDLRSAALLVECGLWDQEEGGYRFHDFHEYNPRREQVDAKRLADRERIASKRAASRGSVARDNGATSHATNHDVASTRVPGPTRPDPTHPVPANTQGVRAEVLPVDPEPPVSRGYGWSPQRAASALSAKVFRRLWERALPGQTWGGPTRGKGDPPDAIDRWAEREGMRAFCTAEEVLECAILRWSESEWATKERWPWPSFALHYAENWRAEDLAERFPSKHGRDPLRGAVA